MYIKYNILYTNIKCVLKDYIENVYNIKYNILYTNGPCRFAASRCVWLLALGASLLLGLLLFTIDDE